MQFLLYGKKYCRGWSDNKKQKRSERPTIIVEGIILLIKSTKFKQKVRHKIYNFGNNKPEPLLKLLKLKTVSGNQGVWKKAK